MLSSHWAYSSGGVAHHDVDGVPRVVLYQAINVLIIFFMGVYLGKKKVIDFFSSKKEQFLQAQDKSRAFLRQAEAEHHEVSTRLDKLKLTKSEALLKAKADATDLRKQIAQDAFSLAQKIKDEAQQTAKIELERAKLHLKEQLIRESFELSKKDLSSKATSDDQKKLQEDFISKVQVVQ